MTDAELITPEEAAYLLSKRAGYQITSEDLKQLRRHGRIQAAKQFSRMTFYERSEIEQAPIPRKRHPLPLPDSAQEVGISDAPTPPRHTIQASWNQNTPSSYVLSFDHQPCMNAAFDDLNLRSICNFLAKARVQSQSHFASDVPIQEKLVQLGLMRKSHAATRSDKQIIPTYGTLLCFGLQPSLFLPGAITRCTCWRGANRHGGWLDDEEYQGNLLEQLQFSMRFLMKHLQSSDATDKDEHQESPEFSIAVLHEAIANALVHREYVNRPDFVHIELFDDRIEISSPGGPPPPMQMNLLGIENRSFPRNHQVAHIFYLAGEIEEIGSGVARMQYFLERSGLPKSGFVLSPTETFRVVLPRLEKTSRLSS